jgi:hypothetical protein
MSFISVTNIVRAIGWILAAILAAQSAAAQPPPTVASPEAKAPTPVLRYVPGSTVKVQQLLGEWDKQRRQLTLSRTRTRYQLRGTDLGYSLEHKGIVYFLFGDTVGRLGGGLDTMATTDVRDPEQGVRLDFVTAPGRPYLTIEPPGLSMGGFETPAGGISLADHLYVVVRTSHSDNWATDRTVLTKFVPPARFNVLRTMSAPPTARFLTMSLQLQPGPIEGLPGGGPFVIIWGTGTYRGSDAYLSVVPAADFETGRGTRYFAGLSPTGAPTWTEQESKASPIVADGQLGDLSVTWCKQLGLWLMTNDHMWPHGIFFRSSATPWGPWSKPQRVFNALDGAGFIHDPARIPDDGLAGPVIGIGELNPAAMHGGAYAPYVVERWTKLQGNELTLYYVLSTWNPYVVVLMKSRFQVER